MLYHFLFIWLSLQVKSIIFLCVYLCNAVSFFISLMHCCHIEFLYRTFCLWVPWTSLLLCLFHFERRFSYVSLNNLKMAVCWTCYLHHHFDSLVSLSGCVCDFVVELWVDFCYRDGRSSREEKSQHSTHYDQGLHGGGGSEHFGSSGASAMLGPNHGQYATLSKQCKTLESSDFYWKGATHWLSDGASC